MNFSNNRTRWLLILAAAILVGGGIAIVLASNQQLVGGPLTSPIPAPGYERNLTYIEVGFFGTLMIGIGVMLGLISIGIRRWPKYVPKEEYIDGVKAISISVASMNYERDNKIIQEVMRSAEIAVHERNQFLIDEPDSQMGWHFFVLHASPNLVRKIIDYTDMSRAVQNMKLEDRFIRWLSQKLEERQCNVTLDLESKKGSSKYGLF